MKPVFCILVMLALSGCWSDTPVCRKLEQEVERIRLGQEADRIFTVAKAFISGDEEAVEDLKLDPEIERRLKKIHKEIMDNKCISWVPLGVRS